MLRFFAPRCYFERFHESDSEGDSRKRERGSPGRKLAQEDNTRGCWKSGRASTHPQASRSPACGPRPWPPAAAAAAAAAAASPICCCCSSQQRRFRAVRRPWRTRTRASSRPWAGERRRASVRAAHAVSHAATQWRVHLGAPHAGSGVRPPNPGRRRLLAGTTGLPRRQRLAAAPAGASRWPCPAPLRAAVAPPAPPRAA